MCVCVIVGRGVVVVVVVVVDDVDVDVVDVDTCVQIGPTALILQSSIQISVLSESIPSLNDFPIITEPQNTEDNNYPALDW